MNAVFFPDSVHSGVSLQKGAINVRYAFMRYEQKQVWLDQMLLPWNMLQAVEILKNHQNLFYKILVYFITL